MAKVLFLVANFYPTSRSLSKQIATNFINEYITFHPRDEIKVLNLCDEGYPKIDLPILEAEEKIKSGFVFFKLDPYQQSSLKKIKQMNDEFMSADKYVIVAPNCNLMVPPQMVDYFLCISQVGHTFDVTDEISPDPLTNKRVLMITPGGSNPDDRNFNVGILWLKKLFAYIGIDDFDLLLIENTKSDQDISDEIIRNAVVDAKIYAKTF